MQNPYTIAYAIGYYYGRAYSADADVPLPEHDMYHRQNLGFTHGLEAGRRDFQEVDLPIIAEQQHVGELILGEGVKLMEHA